jgi:hypothetical protein
MTREQFMEKFMVRSLRPIEKELMKCVSEGKVFGGGRIKEEQ